MFLIFIASIVLVSLIFKEVYAKEGFNANSIHVLKYRDYELVKNAYKDYEDILSLKI